MNGGIKAIYTNYFNGSKTFQVGDIIWQYDEGELVGIKLRPSGGHSVYRNKSV
jgi:hypothetical protein